jgi:hypothetical protein
MRKFPLARCKIAVATDIAATVIGKTCYQLGSNIFEPEGCPSWTQISRMVLVCDVKSSQLGRKNLAVRFKGALI